MTLKAAVKIAQLVGCQEDIPEYTERMLKIEKNFNRILWTGKEYRAPNYEGITDDRANGLAVVAALADKEKWQDIRIVLLTYFNASPYMEKYVLEALFMMDFEKDALNRMQQRYSDMVGDKECSTLWEQWEKGGYNTYNHAWSGGPLTLLSQYTAGVAPLTPAYASY